ncbi:hypothetical protein NBO_853g0001 [Nosema bombycis CQ1]|uniref:Uncharacterized protein n=1 Tax=Nosema bombycis (strain CQ1 / CVCC 102059) TaxID=578461 RepID=R0MCK8_NOSB1|nr:hypothetical protein NBO_853g0001 [Nosema bombycis CQ1]|eukprot:EOB11780.1 hypothetical protein NBO_853g0001 [Nosema bombycis CQ1]
MPGTILYGYSIYEGLEYNISSRTLININNGKIKRFRETKDRLFLYLLHNAEKNIILDEDIFVNVFEKSGLRCSKSYLWAMTRKLHLAFISVGYERAPFYRCDRKGYRVDSRKISEIYTQEENC